MTAPARPDLDRIKAKVVDPRHVYWDAADDVCALVAWVEALEDALVWCSGSPDFQTDGKAREGWLKVCAPLLRFPPPAPR